MTFRNNINGKDEKKSHQLSPGPAAPMQWPTISVSVKAAVRSTTLDLQMVSDLAGPQRLTEFRRNDTV